MSAGADAPGEPAPEQLEQATALAQALRPFMRKPEYFTYFELFQRHGLHVVPVHPPGPVPDTRTLSPDLWRAALEPVGLELNDALQLYFLTDVFRRFRSEYEQLPVSEGAFAGTDALVLYCMIRHFEPRTIISVGANDSARITGLAAQRNGATKVLCVEPAPSDTLRAGVVGVDELLEATVDKVPLERFTALAPGDLLLVDSSHVVKTGSDVNHIILEILPRLGEGVAVHFHDIFLPKEMPWSWIARDKLFWSEQYLLRAFLTFNSEYEVLFGGQYMADRHLDEFKQTFPNSPWWGGGSFWIRRRLSELPAGPGPISS